MPVENSQKSFLLSHHWGPGIKLKSSVLGANALSAESSHRLGAVHFLQSAQCLPGYKHRYAQALAFLKYLDLSEPRAPSFILGTAAGSSRPAAPAPSPPTPWWSRERNCQRKCWRSSSAICLSETGLQPPESARPGLPPPPAVLCGVTPASGELLPAAAPLHA